MARFAPHYSTRYLPGQVIRAGYQTLKALIPLAVRQRLDGWRQRLEVPPAGLVRLGDLRRVTPLNPAQKSGQPIDRYYIENFLNRQQQDIRGQVLEITPTPQPPGRTAQTVYLADLTDASVIPADTFDCIICTQALQFIYDLKPAVQTLYRLLKPGGVLLLAVPGFSQPGTGEGSLPAYWAFTTWLVRQLFAEVFPADNLKVESHGNVLTTTAFLHGLTVPAFQPDELEANDLHYQLIITLRAIK